MISFSNNGSKSGLVIYVPHFFVRKFLLQLFIVYVYVHTCRFMCVAADVLKSGDKLQELGFSFHQVGPRD